MVIDPTRMFLKFIAEFIGTFFFIAIILITGNPLAIGIALAAGIYFASTTSGGALNPAVTLALLLKKKISGLETVAYIIAQVLGGLLAVAWSNQKLA